MKQAFRLEIQSGLFGVKLKSSSSSGINRCPKVAGKLSPHSRIQQVPSVCPHYNPFKAPGAFWDVFKAENPKL